MKKRICFTVWADRLSGAEKRFLRIAPGIITKPRKFDYFFMINEHMYDIAKESQELSPMLDYMQENNRLIIVPEPPVYYKGNLKVIWFNRQFIKNIRKYKIDAAHVVIKAINWTFLPLFLGMKTKIFYELTSPERVDSFFKSPVKYLLPKLTALHCVSPSVNKRFLKVLKENNKELYSIKVYTAPITYFKFPVINNTGPKENLIIFASRFIERKNPILFAEAVKLFLKQKPDWKVAILGSGPLEDKIRAIVKNEIENGSVSVDYTKDIYSYF
ncbi:MAG: glycosyltransferase, partial [Chitinophagaceae bacterium]